MYDIYEVRSGDTFISIANKFKTDEFTIRDINNMDHESILKEGMDIVVPKREKDCFEYYTIKSGDNLYQIAKKYNINPTLLGHINGLTFDDYIYPGQVIMIPKSDYSYYVTQEGDTLETVAETLNVKLEQLLRDNPTVYLLGNQLMVKSNK